MAPPPSTFRLKSKRRIAKIIYLTAKYERLLAILLLAFALSNCAPEYTAPQSTVSTPVSHVGSLIVNIDELATDWQLTWTQADDAWVNQKPGVAYISLREVSEGHIIHTVACDAESDSDLEYVEDFQQDAIQAVLPSRGPIADNIWDFVLDSWNHFWEVSPNNSEYYSGSIKDRDVYYEITLDSDGGLEETIGVGKFQG